LKNYYQFTKAEEERYFDACDALLEEHSPQRIAGTIIRQMNTYVTGQSIREWCCTTGRFPTDVAIMLVEHYPFVRIADLCPWMKDYKKKGKRS
jgi:hypothetical protein